MLKEGIEKLSTESQAELLNEIEIAANRLNRQVENILNMSRLESGMLKPKMDWTDMNELVNNAIHKLLPTNHQFVFQNNESSSFIQTGQWAHRGNRVQFIAQCRTIYTCKQSH